MRTILILVGLASAICIPVAAQHETPTLTLDGLAARITKLEASNAELRQRLGVIEARDRMTRRAGGQKPDNRGITVEVVPGFSLGAGLPAGKEHTSVFMLEAVRTAEMPRKFAGGAGRMPPAIWLLGWDGRNDVMVFSFGTEGQQRRMIGKFMRCKGIELESAGAEADIEFITLFPMDVMLLPRPPKDFVERHRKAIWEVDPDFPRFPPDPSR